MLIITSDYKLIKEPNMSENFLIRPDNIKKIWDVDPGKIGISFVRSYSVWEHEIKLEGKYKGLVAKNILDMLLSGKDATISGRVVKK